MVAPVKIDRGNANTRKAREIPEHVAQEIIKEVVEESVALRLCNTFRMPAYAERIRVLSAFADAYWLTGADQSAKDSALKTPTTAQWDNVYVTPEEVAVMMIVPDAWMDDSDLAWEELRAEIKRAFAKKIDQAIFFGNGGVPSTFGLGLYAGAIASGNVANDGDIVGAGGSDAYLDLADAVAFVAQSMAEDGYDPNGVVTGAAFKWKLARLRDKNNTPLIDHNFAGPTGAGVFGLNYAEVKNGAWDATKADLLLADFSSVKIGIRQDITFAVSDSATLLGADVASSYSAFQQDGKVLRAVMRLGYAVPNSIKALGGTYPVGVIRKHFGPNS